MRVIRDRLAWLVAVCLACQLAAVAAAPVVFGCQSTTPACCARLGPGQTCPMHQSREADRTCKMRSACGPSDVALLALAGGAGLLPDATDAVTAFDAGDVVRASTSTTLARADRPDAPPPKA